MSLASKTVVGPAGRMEEKHRNYVAPLLELRRAYLHSSMGETFAL